MIPWYVYFLQLRWQNSVGVTQADSVKFIVWLLPRPVSIFHYYICKYGFVWNVTKPVTASLQKPKHPSVLTFRQTNPPWMQTGFQRIGTKCDHPAQNESHCYSFTFWVQPFPKGGAVYRFGLFNELGSPVFSTSEKYTLHTQKVYKCHWKVFKTSNPSIRAIW